MTPPTEEQIYKLWEDIGALGQTARGIFPPAAVVLLCLQAAMTSSPEILLKLTHLCGDFAEKAIFEKEET